MQILYAPTNPMEPYNRPWERDVLLILFDLWIAQSFDFYVLQSTVQTLAAAQFSSWSSNADDQPVLL